MCFEGKTSTIYFDGKNLSNCMWFQEYLLTSKSIIEKTSTKINFVEKPRVVLKNLFNQNLFFLQKLKMVSMTFASQTYRSRDNFFI